jgi:acetylornithine deacetylase/succinyl-diaminopimelate desuccinylase-like protein
MIFVPSRDGISHNPAEWTDTEDIALGVQALARALVLADEAF